MNDTFKTDEDINGSKGLLARGKLDNLLKNQDLPNMTKDLVHPGSDPQELLMRTIFKNDKELNAAVNYLSKCKEFSDDEGKNVLLMKLAGRVSVNGLSRNQLVQVLVGQLYKNIPEIPAANKKDIKEGL